MPFAITPEDLSAMIGRPDLPVIIDVTLDEDVQQDPFVIPTAIRRCHTRIDAWGPSLAGQKVIVICQKGLKLSQGAAAWLCTEGAKARFLEGGNMGWADHPQAIRIEAGPQDNGITDRPLWVGTDQACASAWFIKRFIAPNARIMTVGADAVDAVASRFGATTLPALTTLLDKHAITHPPLQTIAAEVQNTASALSLGTLLRSAPDPDAVLDAAFAALREDL